jgi:hypothetical protein
VGDRPGRRGGAANRDRTIAGQDSPPHTARCVMEKVDWNSLYMMHIPFVLLPSHAIPYEVLDSRTPILMYFCGECNKLA